MDERKNVTFVFVVDDFGLSSRPSSVGHDLRTILRRTVHNHATWQDLAPFPAGSYRRRHPFVDP